MSLAQAFIEGLKDLDQFTLREIFMSIGEPMDHQSFVIRFGDGSIARNAWFADDKDELCIAIGFLDNGAAEWEAVNV